ncbi:MAG: FprA family A-type flavoprotein [Candidatus Bathyarchaeota archaeon]|nr:MAG: FprA family A-type flavoprotein [Candidatus Bathyarchaeota archaeon]
MPKLLKLLILYYSQTGNTQKMARAVEEGATLVAGVNVEVKYFARPQELVEADAVILGMPTYHHDIGIDMKRLLEEVAVKGINLKGKIGATFGSYGWSGEAPRMLLEIMENKFEMETIGPPLLAKYNPDEKNLEECRKLGKTVAERIVRANLNS